MEGLPSLTAQSSPKRVVDEFESLFCSIMLKSMRNSVQDRGILKNNTGSKIFTSMLDNQYARQLSEHISLGFSDIVEQSAGRQSHHIRRLPGAEYAAHPGSDLRSRIAAFDPIIDRAHRESGVEKSLIAAVIAQESSGNPHAVSHAGAKGLMQLMDGTARDLGVRNSFDPHQNIKGGSRYLQQMLDRFDNDKTLALSAYNAGPAAVEKYGGVPPYRETMNYVKKVLGYKTQFDNIYHTQGGSE